MSLMGYRSRVVGGVGWIGALRVFVRLLTVIKIAVLARVLTPMAFGQFGIAAMALAFFETLTETGVNQVLTYSDRKLEDLIDSAWIVSIARGAAIGLCIALVAYPLSWYFHDPQTPRLVFLIALVPLIKGFINPMTVVYTKELKFEKEFALRSVLGIVDFFAAVTVGILTHSALAFVAALLVSGALEVVLSFLIFEIRPKLRFSPAYLGEILHYGKWITLSGVAFWVADQLDDFVAGGMYGTAALGVYQAGYKIATLPVTEISGTVNQVAFPALSKVKEDRTQFRKVFFLSALSSQAFGILLAIIVGLFPVLVVRILLGPGWESVIPIVRILALFGAMRAIESSFQPLFLAAGRPKIPSIGNIMKVATLAIGLFLWARNGLVGVSYAALFSVAFTVPYYLWAALPILRR